MKLLVLFLALLPSLTYAQVSPSEREEVPKIHRLIDQYSLARETKDTVLLKKILTEDVDQLVSNGEWRIGLGEAVDGMLRSSAANPGTRKLQVDKIKFLSDEIALVDCRYILTDPNGIERNLWSSFTVIFKKNAWKISAIRNMNPTGGN
jgi:hypothetical protein